MITVITDTLLDCAKLLPFLFATYLIMEYAEHKMSQKTQEMIYKSGKFGPIIGGVLGIFPQCGFSAAASNLYAGRIITIGTLIAIYLSTSDEMLPIFISESVDYKIIVTILVIKMVVGMISGLLIDFLFRKSNKEREHFQIEELCEQEHCDCKKGIVRSAFKHTIHISFYILVITAILNIAIFVIGEEHISIALLNRPVLGPILSGVVGLIPNCAASVIISQLYLEGVLGFGSMLSGLLVGAGVGVLVLFKVNSNTKDNLKVVVLLYGIGVLVGLLANVFAITI